MITWSDLCWWGKDWRAQNACGRRGNMALIRILKLDLSPYVSGGWPLEPKDYPGMRDIYGGWQIIDELPNSKPVEPNGHQVVLRVTPQSVKLVLWVNGAEAPPGYVGPAGSYLALGLVGN